MIFIAAAQLAVAQKTYIQCGKLIDGVANSPQNEMTIVIKGNKIAGIENGYTPGTPTTSAADLLGITAITGSIIKGKFADIAAVDGDPLQDIKTMGNMAFVMKEGKIYKNQ